MEQMKVSEFKANCIAVLARVGNSKPPLLVTRFGKAVVQIFTPPAPPNSDWIGSMKGSGEFLGDIVATAADAEDWETLR